MVKLQESMSTLATLFLLILSFISYVSSQSSISYTKYAYLNSSVFGKLESFTQEIETTIDDGFDLQIRTYWYFRNQLCLKPKISLVFEEKV